MDYIFPRAGAQDGIAKNLKTLHETSGDIQDRLKHCRLSNKSDEFSIDIRELEAIEAAVAEIKEATAQVTSGKTRLMHHPV